MSNWYLLRTATRRERNACESLTEMGVEHFLPAETVLRKLNREEGPFNRPLFPGYLFAKISDGDFHDATHAFGVHGAVLTTIATGERVALPVRPAIVREIRDAQAAGEFDRTKPPPAKVWTVGETLRVVSGHFTNRVGAFMEVRPKDRIAALIRGCIVELEMSEVEAAA